MKTAPKNYLPWLMRWLFALPYEQAKGVLLGAMAGLEAHHAALGQQLPLADESGEPQAEASE